MNRRDWITVTTGVCLSFVVPTPDRTLPPIETNMDALKPYHGQAVEITYASGMTVRGIVNWKA